MAQIIALLPAEDDAAPPESLLAALELLENRGIEIDRQPSQPEPDLRAIVSSCDLLLLSAAGRADWLHTVRDSAEAGTLPIAVWGDRASGLSGLDAGADLWLDPARDAEELALQLAALARRAQLGGTPRLDSLTGLIGHRWMGELLRHEFDRASRYRRAMGLMVIEPDPLEKINHDLGIEAGDRALREMALLLRSLVREVDLLGRLSGKRFAVVLPETDAAGALIAAERLRAAVDSALFPVLPRMPGRGSGPLKLPVSIGLCAYPVRGMNRAEDLLGRALEALVQARGRGGNCVVAFGASDVIWSRDAPDPGQF